MQRRAELAELDLEIEETNTRLGALSEVLDRDEGSAVAKARDEVERLQEDVRSIERNRDRLALLEAIVARDEREYREAHQPDVLRRAGREWFVVHAPGHTEDHIWLHNREDGLFLAGDHVLTSITPHISGLSTFDDPLKKFFDSLDQVAALPDVQQALPAHGHPFTDLAGRALDIKRHHDARLERVREISRMLGGPGTVKDFSQQLFKQRSWGPMAESETYAHLEHMRILGNAERTSDPDGNFVDLTS